MVCSHSTSSSSSSCLNRSKWINLLRDLILLCSFEHSIRIEPWWGILRLEKLKVCKTHMRLESSYHRALPYRLRSMLHNQSRSLCKLVVHFLNRKRDLLIILEFSKRFSFCIPFLLSHKQLIKILKMMNLFGVSMVKLLNDRFCRVIQKLNFGFFKCERTLGSGSFTLLLNQYLSLSVIGIFYLLKLFHP